MFILYAVLFLGGFYLFGLAFAVDSWQSVIFTAGILLVSLAVALPIHFSRHKSSASRK